MNNSFQRLYCYEQRRVLRVNAALTVADDSITVRCHEGDSNETSDSSANSRPGYLLAFGGSAFLLSAKATAGVFKFSRRCGGVGYRPL